MNLIKEITVTKKDDNSLVTRIFEDEEGIKEITSDDYEVVIKFKNSQSKCESDD